jgi:hypothetical protein
MNKQPSIFRHHHDATGTANNNQTPKPDAGHHRRHADHQHKPITKLHKTTTNTYTNPPAPTPTPTRTPPFAQPTPRTNHPEPNQQHTHPTTTKKPHPNNHQHENQIHNTRFPQ